MQGGRRVAVGEAGSHLAAICNASNCNNNKECLTPPLHLFVLCVGAVVATCRKFGFEFDVFVSITSWVLRLGSWRAQVAVGCGCTAQLFNPCIELE